MKKIVIACDSFKGSLTSEQVSDAVESGITAVFPACEVCRLSIADGGEGTTRALMSSLKASPVSAVVRDPLMRPVEAVYAVSQDGRTAIIETAAASGLALLAPSERDPMRATTFGTGQMIADAFGRGCRNFLVGIGGSATNDGGVGMLRALGFRFLDARGAGLSGGGEALSRIRSVDDAGAREILNAARFTVACDVDNPLVGPHGAAAVFAPQKGADADMVRQLDDGLRNFARVIRDLTGEDIENTPGAGAAGGLGAGFKALLGARLVSGIDMILETAGFERLLDDCDLVITGEGRMDAQTLRGKAPFGVLKAAARHGVPVVAIAGSVDRCEELNECGFHAVFPVQCGPLTLEDAMDGERAAGNVRRTVRQMMRLLRIGRR